MLVFVALNALLIVISMCLARGVVAATRLAPGIVTADEHRDLLVNELNRRVGA